MKKKVLIAGPPTSDTQLVLSRQVLVPQRWFTPQEKALDERILLKPVTSYSDKNYAAAGGKTADDAPSARSSCLPVLQSSKSLVPIQQWPHATFCSCVSHTRFPLSPLAWWLFNLLCKWRWPFEQLGRKFEPVQLGLISLWRTKWS